MNIIDLGNIKTGFEIEDTYFALSNVFTTLMKYRIIPIVLGGSQDLTYPIYQVYENTGKLVNITSISIPLSRKYPFSIATYHGA